MKTRFWLIGTALWLTGCAAPSRVVPIQCPPPPPIPVELSHRPTGSYLSQLSSLYQDWLTSPEPAPEAGTTLPPK